VVLEATTNAWTLYDQLAPLVLEVKIAHRLLIKIKRTRSARVKTDTRDTLHVARVLAAGLIPPVWVPPPPVRELRALVVHRQRLVRQRTQAANRLHSVLHARQILPPPGRLGSPLAAGLVGPVGRADVGALARAAGSDHPARAVERLIAIVDAELTRLSTQGPWTELVPFLMQRPGFAVVTSMTRLAAIGDSTRLPSAKKLVGYSGLGAGVPNAGQTHRSGPITKQGRRELRTVLVEAAWSALEHHPSWHAAFERLVPSLSKGTAIVAMARKLLVVVWQVLTKPVVDRHADLPMVTRKRQRWGTSRGPATQHGLSRSAFARQYLRRLGWDPSLERWPEPEQEGGASLPTLVASCT
jgi:transposase